MRVEEQKQFVNATTVGGTVIALVPAAGRGIRLEAGMPKAFVELAGTPMLVRAVEGLLASGCVDAVVVIVPADLVAEAAALLPAGVQVVVGGAERTDSVRAGLRAADAADYVLVHDAARALTPPSLIRRVVEALRGGRPAVIPGLAVVDTIKAIDASGMVSGTPDRAGLRAVQTPQGFRADVLRRAYAGDSGATDDAALVEQLGEPVFIVDGDELAFKITRPLDLALAEALLA